MDSNSNLLAEVSNLLQQTQGLLATLLADQNTQQATIQKALAQTLCCVCANDLVTNDPRCLIPCGHSVCANCLPRLGAKCPQCRAFFTSTVLNYQLRAVAEAIVGPQAAAAVQPAEVPAEVPEAQPAIPVIPASPTPTLPYEVAQSLELPSPTPTLPYDREVSTVSALLHNSGDLTPRSRWETAETPRWGSPVSADGDLTPRLGSPVGSPRRASQSLTSASPLPGSSSAMPTYSPPPLPQPAAAPVVPEEPEVEVLGSGLIVFVQHQPTARQRDVAANASATSGEEDPSQYVRRSLRRRFN